MTSTRESKELNRRRSALETYVEPLLGANNTNTNSEDANAMVVSEFMSTFNKLMTFYESDFKQELSKFPETVGKYYHELVPSEVNHKTFLQRYFFRCWDMERIKKDLDKQQSTQSPTNKEEEKEKEEPATTTTTTTTTAPEKAAPVTRRVATRPKTLSRFSTVRGSATKHTTSNPVTVPPRRSANPDNGLAKVELPERMESVQGSSKTASGRSPLNRSNSEGGVRFRGVPSANPLVREAWGDSKDQDNQYDNAVPPPTPMARQSTADVIPTLSTSSSDGLKSALTLKTQADSSEALFKPLLEQRRRQERSISPKRPPPQLKNKPPRRIQSSFDPKTLAQAASQSNTNAPLPHRKESLAEINIQQQDEQGNSWSDIVHSDKEQITASDTEEPEGDQAGETTTSALLLHTEIAASKWKTHLGSDKEAHGRKWGTHQQIKNTVGSSLDNSKPPDSDQSSDIPADGKKLIVLISNMSGNLAQATNQKRAMTIIENCNLDVQPEYIDGADPANKERRNELFTISCISGNYPQFFMSDRNETTFLGDFEAFEYMNDSGMLAEAIGSTKPQLPQASSSTENNYPEEKSKESASVAQPPIRKWGSFRKVERDMQKEESITAESKQDVKPVPRWGGSLRNVIDKGESEQSARLPVPKPILSDNSDAESKARLPAVVRKWMPPRNEKFVETQGRPPSIFKVESELEEIESSEENWKNTTISGSRGDDAVPKSYARRPSWVKPSPEESESPPIETSQPKTTPSPDTETPTEKEERKQVPLWKAFLGLREPVKSSAEEETAKEAPMAVEEAKAPTPVSAPSWKKATAPWQKKAAEKPSDKGEEGEKTARSDHARPSSVASASDRGRLRKWNSNRQLDNSEGESSGKRPSRSISMEPRSYVGSVHARANKWGTLRTTVAASSRFKDSVASSRKSNTMGGSRSNDSFNASMSVLGPTTPYQLASKSVIRADRRRNAADTYTKALDAKSVTEADDANELTQFLADFDYAGYDDDIQIAMAKYPTTVGVQFKNLVPEKVTAQDFWQRYFYRCDEKRILQSLRRREEAVLEPGPGKPKVEKDDLISALLEPESPPKKTDTNSVLNRFKGLKSKSSEQNTEELKPAVYDSVIPRAVTAKTVSAGLLQDRLKGWKPKHAEELADEEKPGAGDTAASSVQSKTDPANKRFGRGSAQDRLKGLKSKSSEYGRKERRSAAPTADDTGQYAADPSKKVGSVQDRLKGWTSKASEKKADYAKTTLEDNRSEALSVDDTIHSSEQANTLPPKKAGHSAAQDRLKAWKGNSVQHATAVEAGVAVQDRLKDWTAKSTTENGHVPGLESQKSEPAHNESISSHNHRGQGGRRGRISAHPEHSPRSGKVIRGRIKRFGQTSPGNPSLEPLQGTSPAEHPRRTLSITLAKD